MSRTYKTWSDIENRGMMLRKRFCKKQNSKMNRHYSLVEKESVTVESYPHLERVFTLQERVKNLEEQITRLEAAKKKALKEIHKEINLIETENIIEVKVKIYDLPWMID